LRDGWRVFREKKVRDRILLWLGEEGIQPV
jgi:hypothetical protein